MKNFSILLITFLCCIHFIFAKDKPRAEFLVEISRDQVYACECYVATASFLISPENTVAMKFHDLDYQIPTLINALTPENAWVHRTNITEVKKNDKNINGSYYFQYKLIEISICPTQTGEIKIPALDFIVAKTDNEGTFQDSLLSGYLLKKGS